MLLSTTVSQYQPLLKLPLRVSIQSTSLRAQANFAGKSSATETLQEQVIERSCKGLSLNCVQSGTDSRSCFLQVFTCFESMADFSHCSRQDRHYRIRTDLVSWLCPCYFPPSGLDNSAESSCQDIPRIDGGRTARAGKHDILVLLRINVLLLGQAPSPAWPSPHNAQSYSLGGAPRSATLFCLYSLPAAVLILHSPCKSQYVRPCILCKQPCARTDIATPGKPLSDFLLTVRSYA